MQGWATGDWKPYTVKVGVLAGVYCGAAKLGLSLAFAASSVTAIWAPTGIALAAILLWGYRTARSIAERRRAGDRVASAAGDQSGGLVVDLSELEFLDSAASDHTVGEAVAALTHTA